MCRHRDLGLKLKDMAPSPIATICFYFHFAFPPCHFAFILFYYYYLIFILNFVFLTFFFFWLLPTPCNFSTKIPSL